MLWPSIAEIKYNGIFGRWDSKTKQFYTRNGNVIHGLDHLVDELYDVSDRDGELVIPNMDFFEMNGLLRRMDFKPECEYWIFDAPTNGTHQERIDLLQQAHPYDAESKIRVVGYTIVGNEAEADQFYTSIISKAYEGVVYKYALGRYHDGKQYDVHKRVPLKTIECKIIGFVEGKGQFVGSLGAFLVEFRGKPVKVGGGPGVTHEFRYQVWHNRDKYMGQMLKVGFKSYTAKGSLQSPKYLGIRWDI